MAEIKTAAQHALARHAAHPAALLRPAACLRIRQDLLAGAFMSPMTPEPTHIQWESCAPLPAGGARGGTGGLLAEQPCSCCTPQWQQQRPKRWTGCCSCAEGPARPEWQSPWQALHIAACAAAVQAQAGSPAWRQQHHVVQVSSEAKGKAFLQS